MNRLSFHDSGTVSLKKVIANIDKIADNAHVAQSPFHPIKPYNKGRSLIAKLLCKALAKITNSEVYIQSKNEELDSLSLINRSALEKLIKRSLISHWTFGFMSPGFPRVALAILKLQPNPNTPYLFPNLWASSAHSDHNQALKVALAEAVERMSGIATDYSLWHTNTKFIGQPSYIPPSIFLHHYNYDDSLYQNEYWVAGKNILTNQRVYLPAALTHLYYQYQNTENLTLIGNANTNGCATYTSHDEACLRGFFELVERDGFLLHWLTSTAPKKIQLDSVPSQTFQNFLAQMHEAELDMHLFDCGTDLGIPSLIMMMVDNKRSSILRVSGVAGTDIMKMIEKLQYSIMKWPHVYEAAQKQYSWGSEGSNLESIQDRNRFWSNPQTVDLATFFLNGDTINFSDYCSQFSQSAIPNNYSSLKKFLHTKNIRMYAIDQTSELAREHGLKVVRMITPDLVDMYFADRERPINQPRLQSFYQERYHKPLTKQTINTIPHPFA